MYPNRTLCAVLGEMRDCFKTHNFSYLNGLIEEAQSMGNRMEGALQDMKDIERMQAQRSELYKEVEELRKTKKGLGGKDDDI